MISKSKKSKVVLIAAIFVLALAFISDSVYAASNAKGANIEAATTAAAEISAEQAKEIALDYVGGGTVTKCTRDYENGKQVYEIAIVYGDKKYEMDIGVYDSEITDYEEKYRNINGNSYPSTVDSTSSASQSQASAATEISAEQAKEIALARAGGGSVTKCKLDYENGKQVYEIEIVNGNKKYEMDVGVYDSQITDYEVETIRSSVGSSKSSYDYDHDDDDGDDDDDDDYYTVKNSQSSSSRRYDHDEDDDDD